MNLDVIVLALASTPRPAGIGALYALLSASPPRRVVVAYLVAGLGFSVTVGVLVVAIFYGAGIDYRGTEVYSVIELLGGVTALGLAVGVGVGRTQLPTRHEGTGEESAILRRLRNPSVTAAMVAGVATHLPGSSTWLPSTPSSPRGAASSSGAWRCCCSTPSGSGQPSPRL